MPTILVVDDSPVDRRLVGRLLEKNASYAIDYAAHGVEALKQFEHRVPDVVLTDLQMPNMDGLRLVESVRRLYPLVPVIVMTAHGSEDVAVKAMLSGAAGFVPKGGPAAALLEAVESVLDAAQPKGHHDQLFACLDSIDCQLTLENDRSLIPPLLQHVQGLLAGMQLADETGRLRTALALEEALLNALYHGNLELNPEEAQMAGSQLHGNGQDPAALRRSESPFCNRRIHVGIQVSRSAARFVIRDDGTGFDPTSLPDPYDPANFLRETGRGMVLMRMFMDEVTFNDSGNEVVLVKRREAEAMTV